MKNGILLLFAILFFSSSSTFAQKNNTKDVEAKRVEREDIRAILKECVNFKVKRGFPIMKIIVDSIKIDSVFVLDTAFVVDSLKTTNVIDSFLKVTKFEREDHETEKLINIKITKERKEIISKLFFAETLSLEEREIVHNVGLEMFYIKAICPDVLDLEKKIVDKDAERAWKVRIEERYEELFDFGFLATAVGREMYDEHLFFLMGFPYENAPYLSMVGVFLFSENPHHYFLLILREKIAMIRTMFQRILRESLIEVAEHPALVRIAFLTGFVHTLWGFWRFAYTFYVVVEKNVELGRLEGTLFQYMKAMFDIVVNNLSSGLIILLVVGLIIGYVFLYPIGHGMMVSYLQHHSTGKAIKTALGGYFTITITEGLLSVVSVSGYHLLALRYFYQWGILNNILVQIIVFLVGMFVIVCSFLYAYGSISCVIDNFSSKRPTDQAWEALQNSSAMATQHIWTTMKFILLSLVLELRFFVTTTIVIAIPAFLVRVALQLGLIGSEQAPLVVMIAIGVLLIAAIYINSIIDAFFTAYWYKLYVELKERPEE